MAHSVTVIETLLIDAPLEDVWRFTQSDLGRPYWTEHCDCPRIVESRAFDEVRFENCGCLRGTWRYRDIEGKTLWVQINTVALEKIWERLFSPVVRFRLRRAMRASMRKAKEALEFSEELSDSLHEDFF